MYLATLSKHPHVNSDQLIIKVYKIYYLIQSRSMTCGSLSRSIMSSLVDPMTRDNLDTNITAHDRNFYHHDPIMISFMLSYVSWTSLIRLKIYINSTYEYQINEEAFHIK